MSTNAIVRADLSGDPLVREAIEELLGDGWRRVDPYRKWEGAHWRLLSLAELGAAADDRTAAMLDLVLGWLTSDRHRSRVVTVAGRVRRCASQEGNALLAAVRLGAAEDPRARLLAESLVSWQWADGGWNCDTRPTAVHASFHETLAPLRGLAAYGEATADDRAADAAHRAARLLLDHRMCRSSTTGEVIDPQWLRLHWPAYWHYDVLQGLRAVTEAGLGHEPGAGEALAWLREQRRPDGTWHPSGRRYWRPAGAGRSNTDIVAWDRLAVEVVTAQATAVLTAAGEDAEAASGPMR